MKRTIRTLIIAIIAVVSYSTAEAQQQKVGFVQFDSLIVLMPQWDTAQEQIKERRAKYQKDIEQLYAEEERLRAEFEKASSDPNMTRTLLELKAKRIQELQRNIQETEQTLQQELANYQSQLISKIADKVKVAVEEVAKEKGYTHVLDKSALVYSSPKDNLMEAVKTKLGIQ